MELTQKLHPYDSPNKINFEHKINLIRADIVLLVRTKSEVLVEVKATNQNLDNHIEQAFEYSNRLQCPYTFLTNGEEFRLYKTFIPNIISPKDRLILSFKREELLDKWYELYDIIAYTNLIKGNFEKYVSKKQIEMIETIVPRTLSDHLKQARNKLVSSLEVSILDKLTTDRSFKSDYENWVNDSNLRKFEDEEKINKLARITAYHFLTKIYFCKILEDRNKIEKRFSKENLSKQLVTTPIRDIIRASYQSVLEIDYRAIFDTQFYDGIYPEEMEIVVEVVSSLNNYDFAQINHDILGKIYEQHISREERKDLGQYYTPLWIIKYIFDSIPIETNNIVLDPACGSGGFLIEAYDRLMRRYLAEGLNSTDSHKNILDHNLFGIDINPFAVMLSAANLALKNIDIPTNEINIYQFNSLKIDVEQHFRGIKKQNAQQSYLIGKGRIFEELPKEYDVIVGNPPFFNVKMNTIQKEYVPIFGHYKSVLGSPTNIVSLFLARYIRALKTDGYLGFVVPKVLTFLGSWRSARKFILTHTEVIKVFDIREAFEDVRLEMVILILRRKKQQKDISNSYIDVDFLKQRSSRNYDLDEIFNIKVPSIEFSEDIFPLYRGDINLKIFNKMNENSVKVEDICYISRGAGINTELPRKQWKTEKTSETCVPILRGRDVQQYSCTPEFWIDEAFPVFDKYKTKISDRKKPKILAQRIVAQTKDHIKIIANYDPGYYVPVDTLIYFIIENNSFDPLYLLGLFNSKLCSYYVYNFIFNRATRSMDFKYVGEFPVKVISKDEQSIISKNVQFIIDTTKKIKELKTKYKEISDLELEKIESKKIIRNLKQEIRSKRKENDDLIFSYYGLEEEEKKLVLHQW